MAGYRKPYSRNEEEAILRYIIMRQGFYRLRGNKFWQEMEEDGCIPERTHQSLKEHFRKKIVNNMRINGYYKELEEHQLKKVLQAYKDTAGDSKINTLKLTEPQSPTWPSDEDGDGA